MSFVGLRSLIAGAVFGAAVTFAGVTSPAVILNQLNLTSFHMLKAFITATATSAIVIHILRRTGLASPTPTPPASLGLFGAYDGNILGGLLLGLGMGLAGACPGTLLPQVATGSGSALIVLVGAVSVGGNAASCLRQALPSSGGKFGTSSEKPDARKHTVYELFNISVGTGLVLYEILCLSILGAAMVWENGNDALINALNWDNLRPVIGGLAIGAAQATNLLLAGRTLGTSAAYELLGERFNTFVSSGIPWTGSRSSSVTSVPDAKPTTDPAKGTGIDTYSKVESRLDAKKTSEPEPLSGTNHNTNKKGDIMQKPTEALATKPEPAQKQQAKTLQANWEPLLGFAIGTYLGASLLTTIYPQLLCPAATTCSGPCEASISSRSLHSVIMVAGGGLIILGSRLAGGCTSGHGISGMSMGAKSSFVTVAAMFAGGIFGLRVLGSAWGFGVMGGAL